MEEKISKQNKFIAKLPLWLLRGTAVAVLSIAIFFFVTSYKIRIEPNCAEAQCVAIPWANTTLVTTNAPACGTTYVECPPAAPLLLSGGIQTTGRTPCGNGVLDWIESYPELSTRWHCGWDEGTATCYALCAQR